MYNKTKQNKTNQIEPGTDNFTWIQRKKRLKLVKIQKENERKYQSGKFNNAMHCVWTLLHFRLSEYLHLARHYTAYHS